MNIYLHVELSARELDSKLLLATLAAENGHHVIVSVLSEIMIGITNGVFTPGIFHTKSLTPSKSKIKRHQKIIDNNFIITSIDEEAGIDQFNYDDFARDRYSDKTIEQSSAVFCWGSEDTETLKKKYSKNSKKIIKTGSPRVDLWKSDFSEYWISSKKIPKKPYLLVASNISCNDMKKFHDLIKLHRDAEYFDRDPDLFKNFFYMWAEDYKKLYSFIDAIKFIADNSEGFDVVLRPHPTEDVKAWEIFLEGVPNVHIIRQDAITSWIQDSFAIMHNGSTTAIEATVSGKPVITYSPFKMEYAHELSNSLGYHVKSKKELLIKVNELLNSEKNSNHNEVEKFFFETKMHIDKHELAAKKILKVWESFDDKKYSQPINLTKFYWLKFLNFKKKIRKMLAKLFPNKIKQIDENYKFPPFDLNDIRSRVNRLQHILGTQNKIECKLLSERTILIKKS